MTSNVGARQLVGEGRVGFSQGNDESDDPALHSELMSQLKKQFRPEFLNRIDEVVLFRPLTPTQVTHIAARMLKELAQRVERLGYGCSVAEEVAPFLAQEGFDPVYGARPLRRALQARVEDPLAEQLLAGVYKKGDMVKVAIKDNQVIFER